MPLTPLPYERVASEIRQWAASRPRLRRSSPQSRVVGTWTPEKRAKTDADANSMGQHGMALASLKIDTQDFREARKPFDGSLHVYGDDSVPRFSGEVLVRLLHERRVLLEDLHAQVGELRSLTTSWIVLVEVHFK
jgi:hypothetical protein